MAVTEERDQITLLGSTAGALMIGVAVTEQSPEHKVLGTPPDSAGLW